MGASGSAIVITAITASLLVVFLWLAEVRMRWKVLALTAFAVPLFLFVAASPPVVFAAGLAMQALLGIALSVYFKAGL
jgi:hypothetical protein